MKSYLKSFALILVISTFCVVLLSKLDTVLDPFILEREESYSDTAIERRLKTEYPDSQKPYVKLDKFSENYTDLVHIYMLKFAQKMPLYAYYVTEKGNNGPIFFVIVFNTSGYIENVFYLYSNEYEAHGDIIESEEFIDSIIGQKAPDVVIDTVSGATISTSAVKKGVENASKNFYYEVMRWKTF